jgi:hypothetical protein
MITNVYKQIKLICNMPKKLVLDIDEDTWGEVLKYKIDSKGKLKLNNDAVVELIRKGLNIKNDKK